MAGDNDDAADAVVRVVRPGTVVSWLARLCLIGAACYSAYDIRMYALREYGFIIHEFDPWFNFRATQYLADNGWYEFFHWFDHMSWYPLGRPVGTTICPGMQITSVTIWEVLNALCPCRRPLQALHSPCNAL